MNVCGAIAKMLGCVSFLLSFSEDSVRGLLSQNDIGARKRENYSTCGGLDRDLFVQYDLIVRTKKL